jgi:hypothetical protein
MPMATCSGITADFRGFEAWRSGYHRAHGDLPYRVIVGQESANQLGGPLMVAKISGDAARMGLAVLLNVAAVLSISIGIINLFPVPMLDGGHLLFFAFEAIRGKPLSERTQEIGFRIARRRHRVNDFRIQERYH